MCLLFAVELVFTCEEAVERAFKMTQLRSEDIDWFGLYDCYPICFVRALEAVGLAQHCKGMKTKSIFLSDAQKNVILI